MKVVRPEQEVPYKNVHRYGETNIRHVERPLKPQEWKKSARGQNSNRPLPETPRETPREEEKVTALRRQRMQKQPPVASEESEFSEPQSIRSRATRPVKADFVISVPIFNETLSHSYRKKNEYVYNDNDDSSSLMHETLSRSSSIRDVRSDRPPSGHRQDRAQRRVKSGSNLSHRSHSHDGRATYAREDHYNNGDGRQERSLERSRERRNYSNDRQSGRQRTSSAKPRYYGTESTMERSGEENLYETVRYGTGKQRRVLTDNQQYGNGSSRRQNGRQNFMQEEKPSRQQGIPRPLSERKVRRQYSGSEASFNTSMTSTGTGHSYIYENMPAAFTLRKAPSIGGLNIDSDEEDTHFQIQSR